MRGLVGIHTKGFGRPPSFTGAVVIRTLEKADGAKGERRREIGSKRMSVLIVLVERRTRRESKEERGDV